MEDFIKGLQTVLNGIGAGTSSLDSVGKGTENYGVAEQKVAAGTNTRKGSVQTDFFLFAFFVLSAAKQPRRSRRGCSFFIWVTRPR